MAREDLRDSLDSLDYKDHWDLLVIPVTLGRRVHWEMQDKQALRALLDHKVQLVLQETLATEAMMDNLANQEAEDCKVHLDHQVRQVLGETRVQPASKVLLVHQVKSETQDIQGQEDHRVQPEAVATKVKLDLSDLLDLVETQAKQVQLVKLAPLANPDRKDLKVSKDLQV